MRFYHLHVHSFASRNTRKRLFFSFLAGKPLELCLQAFVNMMLEGARSWDDVSDVFIKKLASFVEQGLRSCPSSVIQSVVLACPDKFDLVMTRIAYPILANYLECSDCRKTRQAVVALVNALLQKVRGPTIDYDAM